MKKITKFTPAYDKRHSDPSKNYGIHSVNLIMVLKGKMGAVSLTIFTNWYLPEVRKELLAKKDARSGYMEQYPYTFVSEPTPADINYHSHVPQYEGQEPISGNCEYIGGICYCDGSSLQAQDYFDVLIKEGSEGVWKKNGRILY